MDFACGVVGGLRVLTEAQDAWAPVRKSNELG